MKTHTLRVIIVASLSVGIAAFATAQTREPTKGPVPDEAFSDDGRVNYDAVPDYFPVYDRGGIEIAGFVRKEDYFLADRALSRRIEVVDETLSRTVGHMVLGRGFVPLGTPDEAVPEFESGK